MSEEKILAIPLPDKHMQEEFMTLEVERVNTPIIISLLAKGIEAALDHSHSDDQPSNLRISSRSSYGRSLGGPNIAWEIYNREYANARICGSSKWRKSLAIFLRQPHFIIWGNSDLVTHEVMGGLKNVYTIGAGNFESHTVFCKGHYRSASPE
ncbi:hypothetical protein SAY86_005112 [Trapa natans]|uniref:Uncharacterized protein n=1 Tax=Trapa natans TaxID=22666 RepID=A0AAN7L291_TRANT|nr:hypothetical protein SAY86_005112 [Trapa natans]